jgi:hypothetical protein
MILAILVTLAFNPDDCTSKRLEERLVSLAQVRPSRPVYVEDGAGDGSLTRHPEAQEAVKAILACPKSAATVLVKHLDDRMLTHVLAETASNPPGTGDPGLITRRVVLGVLALDLLLQMFVEPSSTVYIADCADDSLGACVEPEFYFRPDAGVAIAQSTKKAWSRLLRSGQLVLRSPGLPQ